MSIRYVRIDPCRLAIVGAAARTMTLVERIDARDETKLVQWLIDTIAMLDNVTQKPQTIE
ncbi:hypothetical protein H5202_14790 [Shewanella sp. SG41-4]|uniref:hypothetical protein n=1 Tax=Shewanella sp. SG41-4 TaxID=2760976 RepID=UPI0015FEF206|nr:hypothetical protein [Shewanella sp. SG41-4]MBB1439916.1 hypothetical protein [Shewanella sp. SG41-4]